MPVTAVNPFSEILIRDSKDGEGRLELVFDPGTENELTYSLNERQEEIFKDKLRNSLKNQGAIMREDVAEATSRGKAFQIHELDDFQPLMRDIVRETKELRANIENMSRTHETWRKRTWLWRFASFIAGLTAGVLTTLIL